ncbi:MAG: ferrous iron transport protein B, partial [Planctomycetes bacterium]|nr:ferrous iron transport protein B [Planctomycetota bacterium]
GLAFFLLLMAFVFQAIYAWSGPFMDAIEGLFGWLEGVLIGGLEEGPLKSLLSAAIVDGVGGVLVFLPQILMLFLALSILEETGYMARAAFLMDRLMRPIGLTGRSFIPLLSGFACAIPAIMATRTIADRASRLTTIMIVPLTSCSARLPVYVLMIGLFVPETEIGLGLSMQGLVLLAMYALGAIVAIPVALVFRKFIFKGTRSSFMIELPAYQAPQLKALARTVVERGRLFVVNAGTIIFAMAIVIWALSYFPRSREVQAKFEAQRSALAIPEEEAQESFDAIVEAAYTETQRAKENFEPSVEDLPEASRQNFEDLKGLLDEHASINNAESAELMENSILGTIGQAVEPIFVPIGWDWRISTAAIASFPAREVVIGVMGTIFSQGEESDEESEGLHDAIKSATWPDGRPLFTLATALSLMVFFALCMQCGASVAAIKREMNSWKWATISFVYMTVLAYVFALITFQVTNAFR